MPIGKQTARAAIATNKSGTTRDEMPAEVRAARDLLNEWLSRREEQDLKALADFAASRQGQYNTFVSTLPDPAVDQTP